MDTDDFLLTLVHDLRAYVRTSLAGVQLIERSLGEGVESAVRQRFESVIGANKEMDRFLSRLSDYAGSASLRKGRTLPLVAAIQSAALQFPPRTIDLTQVESVETATMVPQEAIRLFAELIDNAFKFSNNGPVKIHLSEEVGSTQVTIQDSGIGIRLGEEERVFGLLVRLHSNDDYQGFGLGLPICRRIAHLMDAHVGIAGNPTGGTIATVTIRSEN